MKRRDPFGYTHQARGQAHALETAKKARTSLGFGRRVVHALGSMHFSDDRFRNELQRAQGGLPYKTAGLNTGQVAQLRRAAARAHR